MKAIRYRKYGSPDVLEYEEVPKPVPTEDEVLLQVRAASVNPYDWHFMRGTPYIVRIVASGLRRPKFTGLGADVAGRVESVGDRVTQFKPGDAVFGTCKGSFAEYACASDSALVTKPANVTFEQAACIPLAALTALQALRKGQIQTGQKVLINGASGGVGSFAVQIAKCFDTEVTGVCSTRNVDMVRSIGADHVIDYNQLDFTKTGIRYDLFLDCVGNRSLLECRRVLKSVGICVAAGGRSGRWRMGLLRGLRAMLVSQLGTRKLVGFLAKSNKEDLTTLRALLETEKLVPVIDRRYLLDEVPEAIRYIEAGHARGKVVISLG